MNTIMKVEFTIDLCNETHVQAMEVFMRAVGGLSHPLFDSQITGTLETAAAAQAMLVAETPQDPPKTRTRKQKETPSTVEAPVEAPQTSTAPEEPETPVSAFEEEDPEPEPAIVNETVKESKITLETVRGLMAEKLQDPETKDIIRPKIMKLMQDFGCDQVSLLSEDDLPEVYEQLKKIKA